MERILFLVVVLCSLSNAFALTHGQAQSMLSAAGDFFPSYMYSVFVNNYRTNVKRIKFN